MVDQSDLTGLGDKLRLAELSPTFAVELQGVFSAERLNLDDLRHALRAEGLLPRLAHLSYEVTATADVRLRLGPAFTACHAAAFPGPSVPVSVKLPDDPFGLASAEMLQAVLAHRNLVELRLPTRCNSAELYSYVSQSLLNALRGSRARTTLTSLALLGTRELLDGLAAEGLCLPSLTRLELVGRVLPLLPADNSPRFGVGGPPQWASRANLPALASFSFKSSASDPTECMHTRPGPAEVGSVQVTHHHPLEQPQVFASFACSAFGHATQEVDLTCARPQPLCLEPLAHLPKLRRLRVWGGGGSALQAAEINQLTGLQRLAFTNLSTLVGDLEGPCLTQVVIRIAYAPGSHESRSGLQGVLSRPPPSLSSLFILHAASCGPERDDSGEVSRAVFGVEAPAVGAAHVCFATHAADIRRMCAWTRRGRAYCCVEARIVGRQPLKSVWELEEGIAL